MIGFFKRLFSKKIVVYTAIFGDYDTLKHPNYKIADADFVCFTDKDITSDFYKIIRVNPKEKNPKLDSGYYKLLPHKFFSHYQYSIWVDGSMQLKFTSAQSLIEKYLTNRVNYATFVHPERDCIYDEANECIKLKRANREIVEKQIAGYKKDGFPKHFGLTANGIIIRKHNEPNVIKVCEDWWKEVSEKSERDQLSFNYVVWKNSFNINLIKENIFDSSLARYIPHLIKTMTLLSSIFFSQHLKNGLHFLTTI